MVVSIKTKKLEEKINLYPLTSPSERLSIWKKAKGMWKNRKQNSVSELKKIRREWNNKTYFSNSK